MPRSPSPPIPAIVLTFDRNAVVTQHMIARYEALWPEHPFIFRIPYQDRTVVFDHPRCEFVSSPSDIQGSVRALLAGLDDDAWIYWCIDDKYPTRLDLASIEPIVAAIASGAPADVSGVLFCRCRRMLDPAYLTDDRAMLGGQQLLGRSMYQQIWIHQFLRVKVLRQLFRGLPETIRMAKEMDPAKDRLVKPVDHRIFVTERSLAAFGESTMGGVLTRNCLDSLVRQGLPVPSWQPEKPQRQVFMGLDDEPTRP